MSEAVDSHSPAYMITSSETQDAIRLALMQVPGLAAKSRDDTGRVESSRLAASPTPEFPFLYHVTIIL